MWGRLTRRERLARRALLGLIVTEGEEFGLKRLASQLDVSQSEAAKLLSGLERKGFLVRDRRSQAIEAAYPLSIRPTQHQVVLKDTGQRRYALCAIDALGVGPLFGGAVVAKTKCAHCRRAIRVHVEENAIVAAEPPRVAIWYALPELLTKRKLSLNLAEIH